MYILKRLGNESSNKKIIIRLKKRIVNDLYNIRRNNEIGIKEINLLVYPAKAIDMNDREYLLKNYNEYYNMKNLSLNYIKNNIRYLL